MIPLFDVSGVIKSYEESIGYYPDADYDISLLSVNNGKMKIETSNYKIKKNNLTMTLTETTSK
jgi:hypothetical protein